MIFIDTGAFIAAHLARDSYHSRALSVWRELQTSGESYYTSNFVLDEAVTFIARRAGYPFAAEIALDLYNSRVLRILRPTDQDERAALSYFRKFSDQEVSFTDCVSFVLMRLHGIERAFTFDRHFQLAGFTVAP